MPADAVAAAPGMRRVPSAWKIEEQSFNDN
jgi:hypothetical protein